MLFSKSLHSSLVAACWLLRLTNAQQDAAQSPLTTPPAEAKNPNEGMMPVIGQLVSDCAPTVSVCGSVEETLIEQEWVNVVIAYQNQTVEKVKTLPTSTEIRTLWEFETSVTSSAGRCRNTSTIQIDIPTTITLNRTITTTREFVPVTHAWVKSTSTIKVTALDQCYIPNPSFPTALPGPSIGNPINPGGPSPLAAVVGNMKDSVIIDDPVKPPKGAAAAAASPKKAGKK